MHIWELIQKLSTDLGDGLQERAADGLLSVPTRELDDYVIAHVCDDARQQARKIAHQEELRATLPQRREENRRNREYRERMRENPPKDFSTIMSEFKEAVKRELIVEWTRDLLDTEIALPDGSRTTWGAATAAEHTARMKMLDGQTEAAAQNSARHSLALDRLAQTGAACLNEAIK